MDWIDHLDDKDFRETNEEISVRKAGQLETLGYNVRFPDVYGYDTNSYLCFGFPYEHVHDRYHDHIEPILESSLIGNRSTAPKRRFEEISSIIIASNDNPQISDKVVDNNGCNVYDVVKAINEQTVFLHSIIATFPNIRNDGDVFLTTFFRAMQLDDIAVIINHKDKNGNTPLLSLCMRDMDDRACRGLAHHIIYKQEIYTHTPHLLFYFALL